MRLRQAVRCLANAEIAVFRVSAQTVGFKVLVAMMADGDALFRTSALLRRRRVRGLGFEFFSCRGFGGGLARGGFARWRFFLRSGLYRGPRGGLLFGH